MAHRYPICEYSASVSKVTVFPMTISSIATQVPKEISSPNSARSARAMPIGARDLSTERIGSEMRRRAAAFVKM